MRKLNFATLAFSFILAFAFWISGRQKQMSKHEAFVVGHFLKEPISAVSKGQGNLTPASASAVTSLAPTPSRTRAQQVHGPQITSVWERLEPAEVVASKVTTMPDGSKRRSSLLRLGVGVHPRTGKTAEAPKYRNIVYEGNLPEGNEKASNGELENVTAKVADQLIVKPSPGMSEEAFRTAVAAVGLSVRERISPDGPYIVELPQAGLDAVDQGIGVLEKSGAVAFAEPDYLVFTADIPSTTKPVDIVHGRAVYSESALDDATLPPVKVSVFHPTILAAEEKQRISSLPSGASVVTFDPPGFLSGPGTYRPSIEEKTFRISTSTGLYVQGALNSGYPNNGSYYGRSLLSETDLTIRNRKGIPFTIFSIDLSEYSTVFTEPKVIKFTGYKTDGTTVTQSFTTDGIIDGTGSAQDFQTFTFDPSFTGLTKVVAETTGFMFDNITVLLEGVDPPSPPLALPLIYDVNWSAPEHTVDQISDVGGQYAPASVNFGTPTVKSQIGTMDGPALEFLGSDYQQIAFNTGRKASAYRIEFDGFFSHQGNFDILFDGAGGTQLLSFQDNGILERFQAGKSVARADLGAYPRNTVVKVAVQVYMASGQWEIFLNGSSLYRGTFQVHEGDLSAIRLNLSGSPTGPVGVDNLKIYAYDTSTVLPRPPKIRLSPRFLKLGTVPIGVRKYLNYTIYNDGEETLNVTKIFPRWSQFRSETPTPLTILPGGSQAAQISFLALNFGYGYSDVEFTCNDPDASPFLRATASATGEVPPAASFGPTGIAFAIPADSTATRALTVGNKGPGELKWNVFSKGLPVGGGTPPDPAHIPDDTQFPYVWSLKAPTSLMGGIDAVHAWSLVTGANGPLIAVIDSGIDRTHPDLSENIAVNALEIPDNGIDDDHNGYIDDVYGWDFLDKDADPNDLSGHGTHVAGTIAARGNNALGVVGVCWQARLLPIRFTSDRGVGTTSDAVASIRYATSRGARVSNNSWGGGPFSFAMLEAIEDAGDAGSLFVAAAGNDGLDLENHSYFPATYTVNTIIAVASTDQADQLSPYSNYDSYDIDFAAPGDSILSLRPGGQYAYLSGTSMAAPHVTGTIGLLLARDPKLTASQIDQLLSKNCDTLDNLFDLVSNSGRLNAYRAVKRTIPGWLKPQSTSGVMASGGNLSLPIVIDPAGLAPGTYNQVLSLVSNDQLKPEIDLPVQLKVLSSDGYSRWQAGTFGTSQTLALDKEASEWGSMADPDGDGLSNLLEYVIGSNAKVYSRANEPRMVVQDEDAVFEFQVRADLSGAGYEVQWNHSLDAATWRTAGLTVVENTTEGVPAGQRKIRVKLADRPARSAFFRLVAKTAP